MMKTKILSIILFYYITHNVCEENTLILSGAIEISPNDELFNDEGYPNVGDIPILNRKIFRGTRVNIQEHAYVVSIRREFSHLLTGSLITRNIVLTVAHPIYNVPINELGVVVGENYSDRGTSLLTVILVLIHQYFDPNTLVGDIAIVRFYEDVVYRSNIKNIPLMSFGNKMTGVGIVTGWGRCDFTGKELCLPRSSKSFPDEKVDPMLRSISFSINSSSYYCSDYEKLLAPLREGMLCAGQAREENPVAPCLAVPGAPLVADSNLMGILSWGFGCGYLHDLPLVYTNISYYTPWIVHNINVLKNITKENATSLFSATKSYRLLKWLNETRLTHPVIKHGHIEPLQQTDIDIKLTELKGEVYDIRDFVYNKTHRAPKREMFGAIKLQLTNVSDKNIHFDAWPFLDNKSLNMDYYFDNFEDA